ncbi:MAG: type II/IV secretion system ATPase subunit [Euryarchaeota archaeon]|nr:type II/IV secretion system ATPase subunit [Euryarchaeota archaeon]
MNTLNQPSDQKIQQKKKTLTAASIIAAVRQLAGRKKEEKRICSHRTRVSGNRRTIILDCKNCLAGEASITHIKCRENIFQILISEPEADRLVLSHLYERDYEMENLEFLYLLARFIDGIRVYRNADLSKDYGKYQVHWEEFIHSVIDLSASDPIKAYIDIRLKIKSLKENQNIEEGKTNFISLLEKMVQCVPDLSNRIKADMPGYYYETAIKSLVRPGFSSSRIYAAPPPNTEFIEGYEVQRPGGRVMQISRYKLTDRPETLYFAIPVEYNMRPKELEIIEAVRKKLMKHRPRDLNFSDPANSREYFRRLGKQKIVEEAGMIGVKLTPDEINTFSDILAKYTTGLGILEDVLSDERVTDVYVNSPADINPVHIAVDGEECISNIYLSQDDIDSMITRFRAISGRPFGEANPVLDMDLSEFKTRVSVIGNPLAAGGLAYAFRKHANNPWTLPKLINMGSITPLAAGLLSFLIDGQSSILVAGGVGAGKTSLLSAMLLEIPQKYRILTIEDTPELPIEGLQKLGWKIQGMHTKSAVGGSEAEIAPEMALRAALRMGNSTLVLGEVRGPEVKVLYEAMQVGTAGNSVIGTIHGASTRAVFERIVNSLGVPVASFRATDAVVVCQNVRLSGTMSKKKRVVQIAEVTGGEWKEKPDAVDIFNDIMVFDPASDLILATDLLDKGQSELVNKIAGKWGLTIDEALLNIKIRAMIKQTMANIGKEKPQFLEADVVGKANNIFWYYQEEERDEKGKVDFQAVYQRWVDWYSAFVENNK